MNSTNDIEQIIHKYWKDGKDNPAIALVSSIKSMQYYIGWLELELLRTAPYVEKYDKLVMESIQSSSEMTGNLIVAALKYTEKMQDFSHYSVRKEGYHTIANLNEINKARDTAKRCSEPPATEWYGVYGVVRVKNNPVFYPLEFYKNGKLTPVKEL